MSSASLSLRPSEELTLRHNSPHSAVDDQAMMLDIDDRAHGADGRGGAGASDDIDSAVSDAAAAAAADSRLTHHRDSPLPALTPTSLYRHDAAQHAALLSKVTWRILPFLLVLYTFSFLDRSNLSNVHKSMLADIDLTEEQYGTAAGIFFLPYMLLEIPSNMILERVDARRWLARIIGTWGCISTLMLAINHFEGLCVARFLLGVAESGFFPGIIFYLTLWFTPAERAQRLAFIFVAQPISGILGGLLAYPILTYMDGVLGMAGWRWVFFLEGAPTIALGVVTWYYLPATPMEATWLTMEERVFLTERMKGVERGHGGGGGHTAAHTTPAGISPNDEQRHLRADSIPESSILIGHRSISNGECDGDGVGASEMHGIEGEGAAEEELQRRNGRSEYSHPAADTPTVRDSPKNGTGSGSRQTSDYVAASSSAAASGSGFSASVRGWLVAARSECISLYHSTFSNRILYLCLATNFLVLMPVQSITFYLPSIVAEIGVGPLTSNLVSAVPYTCAGITMFLVSHYSDRTGLRARPIIVCNVIGFLSLGLTAIVMDLSARESPPTGQILLQLACLSFAAVGIWSAKPTLMTLFTTHLPGNAAVAIAAVTTFGNFSGVIAPVIMSTLRAHSGSYATGCLFLMACLVVASFTVAALNREINRALALHQQRTTADELGQLSPADGTVAGEEEMFQLASPSASASGSASVLLPTENETRSKLR